MWEERTAGGAGGRDESKEHVKRNLTHFKSRRMTTCSHADGDNPAGNG